MKSFTSWQSIQSYLSGHPGDVWFMISEEVSSVG